MRMNFGVSFDDLNNIDGLRKLDEIFLNFLKESKEEQLYEKLLNYRLDPKNVPSKNYSELLIAIAPFFDDFLAELFSIQEDIEKIKEKHREFDIIYECKRKFIQRFAIKKYPIEEVKNFNPKEIISNLEKLLDKNLSPENFAKEILKWQKENKEYELDIAAKYAAFMVYNGNENIIFNLPKIIDPENLITEEKITEAKKNLHIGFDYFAPKVNLENSLNNASYCIYCHKQDKDSCSKGFKSEDKKNLSGCPLNQKISEMNYVKVHGFNLSALAIIIIDNPLLAATGHRICNDCSNSCIYQKQDPVDIPLVETEILDIVLDLPFGLEIYLLLTKWNPLNIYSPLPKETTNYKILVAGLGPAGFGIAHYLLNEGHNIVAIDGLKISNLPFNKNQPIQNWSKYQQLLSKRTPLGFGGVAEYGITNRWDKNKLTILRLILERRTNFKLYGGIMLDANITKEQAFDLGFDHIAYCTGAGAPKFLNIENAFAKGVRSGADFLMALQLNGAFLEDSNVNLLIRMPVAIIGGGLTSIDAATEALNYYPVQVEKFLKKYERVKNNISEDEIKANWSKEDKEIAEEFISHAKLFRKAKTKEEILKIIEDLGSVTIYYRRDLKDSPSYKLNHEEIIYSMGYNIKFLENSIPIKFLLDEYDNVDSIEFKNGANHKAKTILIAIGTENKSLCNEGKISYFGDCNPEYAGSVVQALASAKYGYEAINKNLLADNKPVNGKTYDKFIKILDDLFISRIEQINYLSDNITELLIYSPLAVKNFKAGQFFKLQNYNLDQSKLIEPLALTGAYCDEDKSLLSLIILDLGQSSKLCRNFRNGEIVSLMGPSGTPTEIIKNSNVVLVGGGIGNAVLFSIGKALKDNGCKVTYFAAYKKMQDRFYHGKIEEAANIVIWCCQEDILSKNREEDYSFKGDVIEAIKEYTNILGKIDRVISIGSDGMMKAIKDNNLFSESVPIISSINSPMQCMMKGICGQCVQATKESYIFTCKCQDQNIEIIDFDNLSSRLKQNSLLEKLQTLL